MIDVKPSGGDDTGALQNAINSLPSSGGVIQLWGGEYHISESLIIGNGSATAESTRHGVSIRGEGAGPGPLATSVKAPTSIKWTGHPLRFMIEVKGPVCGIGLQDLQLDGSGTVGSFLHLGHVAQSVFRDVSCTSYTKLGMKVTTVKPGHPYGSSGNLLDNFMITDPRTRDASGAWFDGGVPGLDTCSCTWIGGAAIYGGAETSFGLCLEGADNNAFLRTNFLCFTPGATGPSVLFDPWDQNKSFPLENCFYACSLSTTPQGDGLFGNMFLPLCAGDLSTEMKMPATAGGIHSMRGMFGRIQPRSALPNPHDPQFVVTSTNGAHNGAGGIGFQRQGWSAERGAYDELVGTLFVDYFNGPCYRDINGKVRRVKLED